MEMKPFQKKTSYYETDQMSVIHHSNYIRWFEDARNDCLEQLEIPYAEMEERGIIIPVIGVSAEYKTMTHFGETVEILLKLESYNSIRFAMSYEVRDVKTGVLRCTGKSQHCFIDRKGMPISLKKAAPDYHEKFMEFLAWSKEEK